MPALLDKLFSRSQADAIRILWKDKNSRLLIQREIGKQLLCHEEIIDDPPLTQFLLIASTSPFASSDTECSEIASILYWGIRQVDILPMVTEHQGKELAYRCLISLGIFKEALRERCDRHGAPSPDFYRIVGVSSFNRLGMTEISSHFTGWESFLSEMFVA